MSNYHYDITPLFLPTKKGYCFVLEYSPVLAARNNQSVLLIPPFAEENNNTRKVYSAIARHLVSLGYSVLAIDLYGTGDSEGQFIDAEWLDWVDNLKCGFERQWQQKFNCNHVIATRLGALLLTALLQSENISFNRVLLLQPISKGKTFVKQLLRTKLAAMAFKGQKTTRNDLMRMLADDGYIEISGYQISRKMLLDIEKSTLFDYPELVQRKTTINIVLTLNGSARSQECDLAVSEQDVHLIGPMFWSTPEYKISDELVRLIGKTISHV